MTSRSDRRPPGAVLEANLEWIRGLARALARDPDAAEELAQEACVAALEAPAEGVRSFRPWLASVMRNLWRERGRSDERRRARETDAREPDRTSDHLVVEVVLFRELAQHALELDEPYKSAVLMRFWGNLPPREIAARLGTTPATIQNRIARGLATLRGRLDGSRGGREAWLSALAPWIAPPFPWPASPWRPISWRPGSWTAATVGGIAVNTKLVVAVAALVAVGAWVALSAIDSPPEGTPVAARIDESLPVEKTPSVDTQPLAGGVGSPSERAAVSVPAHEAAGGSGSATAKQPFRVRGRALDASGDPLSGLSIRPESGGPIVARCDDRGWFEFESEADSGRLASADPAWTTVRSAVWRRNAKIEPLLLVARALDIQGTVQDVHGSPLPSARVVLELPAGFESRFDTPLEASIGIGWGTTAGPDGTFALHELPSIEGAKLSAVLEGYARGQVDEPTFPDAGVVIVLAPPPKPLEGSLRGRVVDDAGNPVAKARVFLGLASVATDERGEFALGFARAVTTDRIVAVAAGWRPAILERPREPRGTDTGWPDTVELVLPGPVLSMRGRVVDTKGEPVADLRVSIADPSPVGTIGSMPAHSEFLGAGGAIPPQALESESQTPEEDGDNFQDWTMWVGPASGFFHYVTTDAQGEFELSGLGDRRYELALQDPKTCSRATSKGHRPGSGVERIVWGPPALIPLVAGKLIGDDGKPIAGARVGLTREAFGVRSRVFGGRVEVVLQDRRDRNTSGEDGSFEFHDVPPQGIVVNVGGEGIIPEGFPLEKEGAPDALTLRVHQRCSFEVVVVTRDLEVEEIALRDAQGKHLDILKIDSEHVNAYTSTALTEGRSGVVSASSAAATLDLLVGDVPVKSMPIRLKAGEVTRIEI